MNNLVECGYQAESIDFHFFFFCDKRTEALLIGIYGSLNGFTLITTVLIKCDRAQWTQVPFIHSFNKNW